MRHRLIFCAAMIAAMVASASATQAQWYVSGNIGASIHTDSDVDAADNAGNSLNGEVSFDTGIGGTAAVGRIYGNWRFEGEFSYRQNDLDKITVNSLTLAGLGTFSSLGSAPVNGDLTNIGLMVNGWYDFTPVGNWVPSIGAGLGMAFVNIDSSDLGIDDTDTVFAYQFGASLGYQVNPDTVVGVTYRFFGTTDPEFTEGTTNVDAENFIHAVEIGLRVRF